MNVEPSDSQAESKSHTAYETLKDMASFNNEEPHKLSLKVEETQTQSQEVTHYEEKESSSPKKPLEIVLMSQAYSLMSRFHVGFVN